MDIFYGNVLGFYALIYLYIGAANGVFRRVFYQNDIMLPLAFITASDFLYSFVVYMLLFLLRGRFDFVFYLKDKVCQQESKTSLQFLYELLRNSLAKFFRRKNSPIFFAEKYREIQESNLPPLPPEGNALSI